MKTKILADFQICISVPLALTQTLSLNGGEAIFHGGNCPDTIAPFTLQEEEILCRETGTDRWHREEAPLF